MSDTKERQFTTMYADVFQNMCIDLNYAEFKVYYYILSLKDFKVIRPSYADISRKTKVIERTVRRAVKSLKKKGYFDYKPGTCPGKSNEYKLNPNHIFISDKQNNVIPFQKEA